MTCNAQSPENYISDIKISQVFLYIFSKPKNLKGFTNYNLPFESIRQTHLFPALYTTVIPDYSRYFVSFILQNAD